MDELRKRIEAEELEKRRKQLELNKVVASDFLDKATKDVQWQRDVILDNSTHKALFGERRGGKSTLMGIAAVHKALTTPYAKILYIGLTQDSCQRVMYDEVLSSLKRRYNLPAKLIGNDTMNFDNGSIIYLVGVDANKNQKEKVRGFKAALILIDEMQSYTRGIRQIIDEVVGPTAADTKSAMIIGGTAGNALGKNYWYEVTRNNTKESPIGSSTLHPEWSVWRCQWANNTAIDEITNNRVCDNVRDYLDEKKRLHPGIEKTDSWRQEWDAEWVLQTSSLIYRYTDANLVTSPLCIAPGTIERIQMPNASFLSTATYLLGLDIGYNDRTALTILAYNVKYSNKVYVIETFSKSDMLVSAIAEKIKQLDNFYHFSYMVGDSSNLTVFETLKKDYGLNIQKANRQGKLSHQLVINADLQTQSIIFLPGNEELIQQLQSLTWDPKFLEQGKFRELEGQPNDMADSLLYAHNFSRHMWYDPPKINDPIIDPTGFNAQITKSLFARKRPKDLFHGGVDFALPNMKRNRIN